MPLVHSTSAGSNMVREVKRQEKIKQVKVEVKIEKPDQID
jgi:hypothetical protein